MSAQEKIRCAFAGCHRSIPRRDYLVPPKGWSYIADWGPGVQRGFYCGPHADALEALSDSGELDYIQAGGE